MQNSNEEDFKKKYLKYKAKYLELKDLLEGGIPPKGNLPCSTFSYQSCPSRCKKNIYWGCK
jgi:hypothetical protein